jgi:hypothetical protein
VASVTNYHIGARSRKTGRCKCDRAALLRCPDEPTWLIPAIYAAMSWFLKLAFARRKPLCGRANQGRFRSIPRAYHSDFSPLRIDRPGMQILLNVTA